MSEYLHGDLTQGVIGAAMEVHRTLGPGFVETVYEDAQLELQGIHFHRQLRIPIFYKGVQVGRHRLDLLVEEKVVVELKSVADVTDKHIAFVCLEIKRLASRALTK